MNGSRSYRADHKVKAVLLLGKDLQHLLYREREVHSYPSFDWPRSKLSNTNKRRRTASDAGDHLNQQLITHSQATHIYPTQRNEPASNFFTVRQP